jgi:hypothetical protein
MTSWPLRSRLRISSTARTMKDMSGSLVLVSGVGTETLITSMLARLEKSVEALSLPASDTARISAAGTSSM